MFYSNEWLLYRKAEDKYFSCRYAFMQDEETMVNDLSIALSQAGDNETALRLLVETLPKVSVVLSLLPKVVDAAIDSSNLNTIKLSKDLLYIYKDEPLIRNSIQTLLSNYFAENDDWHYRRIAELYNFLNYKEELIGFVELCRANDNVDIQEVGNDFRSA